MQINPTFRKRATLAVGVAALFGAGLASGLALGHFGRPPAVVAASTPIPIAQLAGTAAFLPSEAVTVAGKIVEKSGNRIVLQDASGMTSMTLGRRGGIIEQLTLGETVSAQGLVGPNGFAPSFIVLPGNRVIAIGHRDGGRGHHERRGPREDAPAPDAASAPARAPAPAAK